MHLFWPHTHVLYIAELSVRRRSEWHLKRHDLTGCAKNPLPPTVPHRPRAREELSLRSDRTYHHSIALVTASTVIPHVVERFCLPDSEQSAKVSRFRRWGKPNGAIKAYTLRASRATSLLPGMLWSRRLHPELSRDALYRWTYGAWPDDSWEKL